MQNTRFTLEVQPTIPPRLQRLTELAGDLLYSWDRQVRGLFYRLDPVLWDACKHNPKVFLRRVSQDKLERAAADRIYVEDYNRVLSVYDTYNAETITAGAGELLNPSEDLVAYFCAEFGFHESFPIYSGGLGILAGDYCKAASDLGLPFVAVGLLYRQGYFTQTIDGQGVQVAHYTPTNFADLPVSPALNNNGHELHVKVQVADREVSLKVWEAKAGRITLYLLDSDLPENADIDRSITYQLYGGDAHTRIQQEIVLGIGGVRALRAVGRNPNVWHINEGHAAFLILERCREQVQEGLDFDSALELVACNTVFTTHTPVAAGHDIFSHDMISTYLADLIKRLGVDKTTFFKLGSSPGNETGFNQTALALRGSRFRNGVSRIHGQVASHMESYVWPQIPAEENPIGYVTNGVHVPTFLAREWTNLFDMRFGGSWRNELLNENFWQQIDDIPDHSYWSLRQSLKADLQSEVRKRSLLQHRRNGSSQALIERYTRLLARHETDMLVIGFARRFATYKRATLLFSDPDRLARLLNNPKYPVLLIFAGKAHPHDKPGQELIRVIHDFSRRPEFEGKIILLEGYDLALGRKLVTGVDVWVNTPQYPLEASGTSGEKAGINGVINLSVLDGWWGEGYNGENGWAIAPHGPNHDPAYRDWEEGQELMSILEQQIVPLYYERNGYGYPEGWVKKSKASMKSIMPRYNAQRMVMDYTRSYYHPARTKQLVLSGNAFERAREVAAWKKKIERYWPDVSLRRLDEAPDVIKSGSLLPIRMAARLGKMDKDDVLMECLVGTADEDGQFATQYTYVFTPDGLNDMGEALFHLNLLPKLSGLQCYTIRMFPFHVALSHRYESGYMIWL